MTTTGCAPNTKRSQLFDFYQEAVFGQPIPDAARLPADVKVSRSGTIAAYTRSSPEPKTGIRRISTSEGATFLLDDNERVIAKRFGRGSNGVDLGTLSFHDFGVDYWHFASDALAMESVSGKEPLATVLRAAEQRFHPDSKSKNTDFDHVVEILSGIKEPTWNGNPVVRRTLHCFVGAGTNFTERRAHRDGSGSIELYRYNRKQASILGWTLWGWIAILFGAYP